MRRPAAIAALLTIVATARAAPPPPVVNGAPEPGEPSVVGLVGADGHLACTGFAVGPRVIVTAAHCLAGGAPVAVFVGHDPDVGGRWLTVVDAARHPGFAAATFAHDLAVVTVVDDLDVPPLPWADGAIDPAAPARVVGFGHTAASGDVGTHAKRTGAVTISAVRELELDLAAGPALPCVGDSGGPVLQRVGGVDRAIGVVSHGDASCGLRAVATRLDPGGRALIADADGDLDGGGCSAGAHPGGAGWLLFFVLVLGAPRGRAANPKETP